MSQLQKKTFPGTHYFAHCLFPPESLKVNTTSESAVNTCCDLLSFQSFIASTTKGKSVLKIIFSPKKHTYNDFYILNQKIHDGKKKLLMETEGVLFTCKHWVIAKPINKSYRKDVNLRSRLLWSLPTHKWYTWKETKKVRISRIVSTQWLSRPSTWFCQHNRGSYLFISTKGNHTNESNLGIHLWTPHPCCFVCVETNNTNSNNRSI